MADEEPKKPNTPKTGAAVAPTAGAAAQSGAAAVADETPKRFTVKATEKTGPVKTYAGVVVDAGGVGRTDNPQSAWSLVLAGYEVLDANNDGKQYDGTNPKATAAKA